MTNSTTNAASNQQLEPCKFCGGESLIEEFRVDDDPQPLFVATCKVCPVKTYDQFSPEEAARIWNARAPVGVEVDLPEGQWQHVQIKAGNPRVVAIQFETAEQATVFINSFTATASPAAPACPRCHDQDARECGRQMMLGSGVCACICHGAPAAPKEDTR